MSRNNKDVYYPDTHFFQVHNFIFRCGLTPIEFTVYCYLVRCAGHYTKRCWPSVKTIARNCHCGETAVRKATKVLKNKGLISVVKTYAKSAQRVRQTNNTYYILPVEPMIEASIPEEPKVTYLTEDEIKTS